MKLSVCILVLVGWTCHVLALDQPDQQILYQISSGAYTMVGGIWGELEARLPNSDQTFVLLKINQTANRADLTILGEDRRTVFLALSNGIVTESTIQFKHEAVHPYPDIEERGAADYVVTRAGNELHIKGAREFTVVCCDIPYYFAHTDVVATEVPAMAIRVSEVEICWSSSSNCTYQVQYRSDFETDSWTNLGDPIRGNGTLICTSDKIPQGAPRRLYRIIVLR
ncbi:MAG TPA: hypothetical protein PLW35_10220 [Verrucomicrobiota bacterium]|nr:hypothetical protein [Verrucomicrobiota bacterium]HOK78082.1 hypothetical protein [Verrucomicrobiota bacterium]